MAKLLQIVLILLFTIACSRCRQKAKQATIENALSIAISKFPQLPKGVDKQANFYRLVRSVTIGENEVEMQLRSSPDTLNDCQKIIIISNAEEESYAIPLFSNTYHDYWNFEFDSILHSVKATNATFEQELKTCFSKLNLYDTLGTAGKVINEMLFSVLQCQQVTEADSARLHATSMTNNYSLASENIDSCNKRLKANWTHMAKEFHPSDFVYNYNAYWDRRNNRVYQFDFKNFRRKQRLEFRLKTYRLDCVFQMFDL